MPQYSYPLTANSGVAIAWERNAAGVLTAHLEAPALQTNNQTLLQQLSKFTEISNGTDTYRFVQDANGSFQLTPPLSDDIHELTVRVRGVDYGTISIASNDLMISRVDHQLTAFEVRVMSQGRNGVYPLADRTQEYTPRTDLHTHFAGALSGEDLIKIGLMKETGSVMYPATLLGDAGIDTSAYSVQTENGRIALSDLSGSDRAKLASAMSIPLDTQDTFNGMEKIYALRGPITKDTALFKPLLWALGRDFEKNGVAYTEQSFSAIINDPDLMRVAHEELPKIQAETGVQIRFLAGLWRHSDDEWNKDEIDRIKSLAKSPHIAGIDIMGHETNPTRDMADQIKELTKWSIDNDPNFTIRVHAGENPLFAADTVDAYNYNNVRETMTLVLDARKELAASRGVPAESLPLPQIRIGHGLYGADAETIRLFKETGATVEFNMTSNLSLNNLDHLGEVPLQKYHDAGIKLVLGTDGAGLYRTSAGQEAILARYAGLDDNGFAALRNIEAQHIDTQTANAQRKAADFERLFEQAKQTGQDPWRSVFAPEYSTPDGQPRMNNEVSARKQHAKQEYLDGIRSAIAENGIVTDPAEIARVKAGKEPILLTGASKSSWPKITPENQQEVRVTMQLLADHINPAKAYILTGGTNFGVEKEMHEAAQRRNAASAEGDKLVVIGTLTTEAKPEEIQRNTVTHAEIVEMNGRPATRWFDLPDATLNMVSENHGTMLAVGGGPVVRDMIQRGHNMGIDMLLMNGPEGASTEKSVQFDGKGYSVEGATALVARLHTQHPDWFKADFNPAHLPQYRAQAEARIAGIELPKTTQEHITRPQEKLSGDRVMPQDNTPVYTPADVESLPRTQVVNTSVRTLQRIDLNVDDDFKPSPVLATDSKGNPVTVGITEVVRDEAGKISGVKYVNPKDSTDKYAVQTFGVKDGVMVLPTATEAQAGELSRLVQSVSGGQGNTVSLAQFDQILRDTHTYYTQQGMVPDIYNSTTKKFAFDPATQSFSDHAKSDDGVFRKAGGIEEVLVVNGEQGKTLGFHAPSANVGTQYGEGSIVLRRDAKGEWRKLDMEYATDNLRNPDGSAIDWSKVATVTPEALDANRLVAYTQAHADMIRGNTHDGQFEARPLTANGETFTELNNARDAILTNPESLAEAHTNVAANTAYLDAAHGGGAAENAVSAVHHGSSIKIQSTSLGTGIGLGLYGLYSSAQTFANDMASGDLGQQTAAVARITTDVSDVGLSAAGSIAGMRGAAPILQKIAGRAAIPLAIASGAFETATAWEAGDRERAAGAVGATTGGILGGIAVGAAGGAAVGAAGGSPTGPGALITATVGGVVGAIGGAVVGEKLATEYAEGATGWIMGTDEDIAEMIRGSTKNMRTELGLDPEKTYTPDTPVDDADIEKVYAYIKASGYKGISEFKMDGHGDSFKLLLLMQENSKIAGALKNLDVSWTPYLDDNADGKVNLSEIRGVLKTHNISIGALDKNGDRTIDAEEIGAGLNAALSKPKNDSAERG